MNKQGIVLVAAIMLLVFASIVVLSSTVFIVEHITSGQSRQVNANALTLAQAGVHNAIYYYRSLPGVRDYFTLGLTQVDADRYFVLGGSASDLLMVDTSRSRVTGSGKQKRNVSGLRIKNATNSKTITVDRMVVTWDNNARLDRITIDGRILWSGNAKSPADADLNPNFTLNATPSPQLYSVNTIRFDSDISNATISVQFIMTDGSLKEMTVLPASDNFNFTVKSTGKIGTSNFFLTF